MNSAVENLQIVDDELFFEPALGDRRSEFVEFAKKLAVATKGDHAIPGPYLLEPFREDVAGDSESPESNDQVQLRFSQSLLLDLVAQGWLPRIKKKRVSLSRPEMTDVPADERKSVIRTRHLVERDAQLSEPSVVRFVADMEKRRLTSTGWHSIFSLMRDGSELGDKLSEIATNGQITDQEEALKGVVKPYIQFAEAGQYCERTGLGLMDIWRYFRHTWSIAYRSVPGRNFQVLIRDAAAENHPVIGIAALGSPVVQSEVRDSSIGWKSEQLIASIMAAPSKKYAVWFNDSIESLFQGVYVDDLFEMRALHSVDIKYPTEKVIDRLKVLAREERDHHKEFPDAAKHKESRDSPDWEQRARTHLFRSKRCELLADLLNARLLFQQFGLNEPSAKKFREALGSKAFVQSLRRVLRRLRAEKWVFP